MAVTMKACSRASRHEAGRDAGVALVWGLAVLQVVLMVGLVVLAAGAQAVARQQAAAAADVAAIAAAQAGGDPCQVAEASARTNEVTVLSCQAGGGDVRVTVSAPPPAIVQRLLALLGRAAQPVVATARAGPPG